MTKTIADILAEMQRDQRTAQKKAQTQRHELTQKFLAGGYRRVFIEFSGSGDSGCIDSILAFKVGSTEPEELPEELNTLVDTWAYLYLEGTNVDWYNNDGGQGTISFDLTEVPFKFEATVDVNETISSTAFTTTEVA